MVFVGDKKYACETCVKGHRSSTCKHTDRPLYEVKKKGRPVTQCEHCRELRKIKQVHVKYKSGLPPGVMGASVALSDGSESEHSNASPAPCRCNHSGPCDCATPRVPRNKAKVKARPRNGSAEKAPPLQNIGEPPVAGPAGLVASAHAVGHRPVLPRPPPPEHQSSFRPPHDPSAPSPSHVPGSRRHSHSQLYSPYGRVYEQTHTGDGLDDPTVTYHNTVAKSADPSDSAPALPDLQSWAAFNPASSSASLLANISLCGCGPACACPGCLEHRGQDALLGESCADPNACIACLECAMLAVPISLAPDAPGMLYEDPQTQNVDEWLREMASAQAQSQTTLSTQPLSQFAPSPGPSLQRQTHSSPSSLPFSGSGITAPSHSPGAPKADMQYDPTLLQTYALWNDLRDARSHSRPAQGEWDADELGQAECCGGRCQCPPGMYADANVRRPPGDPQPRVLAHVAVVRRPVALFGVVVAWLCARDAEDFERVGKRTVVVLFEPMIFLLGCFFFAFVVYKLAYDRRGTPLPPGPRGVPVLGNALQVPTVFSWLKFAEWGKTYGDVIHVSALQRSFIILSSREAITDLLEKRGSIYSDRPIIPMAGELAGAAKYTPLMQYGDRHKEGRKLILGMINVRNAPMLHAIQEAKVTQLVSRLAQDPSNLSRHIRWLVASVVLQVTHGLIIDSCDDPRLRSVQEGMYEFSKMTAPGTYLVDSLPFLMHIPEWIPGAGFKKEAREHEQRDTKNMEELWNVVKEQVAQGTAMPSFAAGLIQNNPDPSSDEKDLYARNALVFLSGGSDTTVSAINSFLIIVAQHPEIQRRAQSEIDQVVGHARLPKLSDRKDLPYLDAVLREVHRINPVVPLSLPHKVRQDDNYRGYRIPAGATVLGNTWAIMHDPSLYPDPHKVHPERYLAPNQGGEKMNPDPRDFAFGYGRRVCPGQMLAEDTLFIAAAAILSVYNVSDAVSLDGMEIKYEGGGVISHPCPFRCTITPRDIAAAQASVSI
ncbi:hypothetical protein EVJ58_g8706 [Rhodofomes roseus]|uniref:Copper-fist domain-containing protein n=1 Tax=Rhodofomes roseus TaxID=34475 RepID=A0A4Y9XYF8_9APHY|nr:hypothetical protein EVJ58_g8706 [Rhodofomes roseus]